MSINNRIINLSKLSYKYNNNLNSELNNKKLIDSKFIINEILNTLEINNDKYQITNYKLKNNINKQIKLLYFNKNDILKDNKIIKLPDNIDIAIRSIDDPDCTITDTIFIIFGHLFDTKFEFLKIFLKNFNGPIIYLLDRKDKWFQNLLDDYIDIIKKNTLEIKKLIFFGTSMGGYGAIASSINFDDKETVCLSIANQTINFKDLGNFKDKIAFADDLLTKTDSKYNPIISDINISKNLIEILEKKKNIYKTKIYTIIGKSECNDYNDNQMDLFFDQFNNALILNYPNISTLIINRATHLLLSQIHLINLINLFYNNFDMLFSNQKNGLQLLKNNIIYF
jgi:hypothetical protein